MPWVKLDDKFHSHPKVMELDLSEVGLWTLAASWCADYLTDGEIKKGQIRRLGGSDELAQKLVEAGLWERVEGGWQFRDWADYQPTKASMEQAQEARRLAGIERAHNRWHVERGETSPDCELCQADSSTYSSTYSPSIGGECAGYANNTGATPSMRAGSQSIDTDGDSRNKKGDFYSSSYSSTYSSPIAQPYLTDAPEPEPLINNPSSANEGNEGDEDFEDWWQHYPKKVDKGDARKAYTKALQKTTHQKLIDGAKGYANFCENQNRERRYIKGPARWLNVEGWDNEDELDTPRHHKPSKWDYGPEAYMHPEEVEDERRRAEANERHS